MIVSEFVAALSLLPQDVPVAFNDAEWGWQVVDAAVFQPTGIYTDFALPCVEISANGGYLRDIKIPEPELPYVPRKPKNTLDED